MTVVNTETGRSLNYATEFDIRDGLATWAEMDGWDVDKEHVVPGWGRPDLYLSAGASRIAVEIKVELSTPSRCRKAIQQAANYVPAMPEVEKVFLVAAGINREAMAPYEAAYPRVGVQTVEQFFGTLAGWASGYEARHRTALARYREALEVVEMRRRALRDLSSYEGSYLSPWVGERAREPIPGLSTIFETFFGEAR